MKFLIQRVSHASVQVDAQTVGSIQKGFLVLIGICDTDDEGIMEKMLHKLWKLRIFEDADGKTNLSLQDIQGSLLLISQFTLYADCRKGNRPSFVKAGSPEHARALYEALVARCRQEFPEPGRIQCGIFGAHMKITLENDGPFTIVLDSEDLA